MALATFGGGCFWGVEEVYRTLEGVKSTSVGYMGGATDQPTYQQVCTGRTDHAEVVHIDYDPAIVSYETLIDLFFLNHNPTEWNRQGPDVGTQYRSVIFYHSSEQKMAAEKAKETLKASGKWKRDIVTIIEPAHEYFEAENYHQQYLAKRGLGSCH